MTPPSSTPIRSALRTLENRWEIRTAVFSPPSSSAQDRVSGPYSAPFREGGNEKNGRHTRTIGSRSARADGSTVPLPQVYQERLAARTQHFCNFLFQADLDMLHSANWTSILAPFETPWSVTQRTITAPCPAVVKAPRTVRRSALEP